MLILALIALTVGQGVGGRLVQWVNNKKVPPILGSSVLGAAFGDAALKRAVFCVVPLLYCGLTVHHRHDVAALNHPRRCSS